MTLMSILSPEPAGGVWVSVLPVSAGGGVVSPPLSPPQAARDRTITRASKVARNFFIVILLLLTVFYVRNTHVRDAI